MVTETGAPHEPITGMASGPEYARNYLQKAMIWAKAEGFLGIDWFTLSDGGDAQDAFERMGLYDDISDLAAPGDARPTSTGVAYLTTSQVLTGTHYDSQATSALVLPNDVTGFVFASEQKLVNVFWAESETSENASQQIELPISGAATIWRWDAQKAPSEQVSESGALSLDVTASPVFVVQDR
jgi:hypothetical protein